MRINFQNHKILLQRFHKNRHSQADDEQDDRPDMPILSWQEQFLVKKVNTSCLLKDYCADNKLKSDEVFVIYDNISMSSYLNHSVDVIILFKEDSKVQLCFITFKH